MTSPDAPQFLAIDTETTLIGPGEQVVPDLVCTTARCEVDTETSLLGSSPAELEITYDLISEALKDESIHLVFHNACFDLTVFLKKWPDLWDPIIEALENGRIHCTKVREKLIAVGTHGSLKGITAPDGTWSPLSFSLAPIVMRRLGKDRSAQKESETGDIWRLNFGQLLGQPADEYPREAADYAKEDAEDTLAVFLQQQDEAHPNLAVEALHVCADFCLRLHTWKGFSIDPEAVEQLQAQVDEALEVANFPRLLKSSILVPAQPSLPYKRQFEEASRLAADWGYEVDWDNEELVERLKAVDIKFKKPSAEKVSRKELQKLVEQVCQANKLEIPLTDKGNTQADADVLDSLKHLDPNLAEFSKRQEWVKLRSDYLPHLQGAIAPGAGNSIHPEYDVLKETGRTSSYDGKLYPSCNIQQVDPRVRPCFVARPGHVLVSVDYDALELVSFAQTTYELFGHSVHRDRINEGVNLHTYLGGQFAAELLSEFREELKVCGGNPNDPMLRYELFAAWDDIDSDTFAHWRKLAKIVGLGRPGGMGDDTVCDVARGYGVTMSVELSQQLGELWKQTYPEAEEWFQFVNRELQDPSMLDEDGRPMFAYQTPMGMLRKGCSYCAAANGASLQSRSAEGAKLALFELTKAFPHQILAFIHDEFIVEVPEDGAHEAAFEVARIAVEGMKQVMPDVRVSAEPTMMFRWNKKAKPVYDQDTGLLVPWDEDTRKVYKVTA